MRDLSDHNSLDNLIYKDNQRLNFQYELLVKMSATLAIINGGAAIAIIGYFGQVAVAKAYMIIALGMYAIGVIMTPLIYWVMYRFFLIESIRDQYHKFAIKENEIIQGNLEKDNWRKDMREDLVKIAHEFELKRRYRIFFTYCLFSFGLLLFAGGSTFTALALWHMHS